MKCNAQLQYQLLLGSYYKYGTYKCYRPISLDRTVRTFENQEKNFKFLIFHVMKNKKNVIVRYV